VKGRREKDGRKGGKRGGGREKGKGKREKGKIRLNLIETERNPRFWFKFEKREKRGRKKVGKKGVGVMASVSFSPL